MEQTAFYKTRQFQIKLYGVLTIVLLAVIGYYSYLNVTKMLDMKAQIVTHGQLHSALSETDKRIDSEFTKVKEENEQLTLKIQTERNLVYPENENHTTLTRALESFANDINRTLNPFEISNLQYLRNIDDEAGYSILPLRLTIQSSYDNFFKFLEYVESSGTLSDQSRLLTIQSIIINFVSPQGTQGNTSGQDEINFNVTMNAFFRSNE